MRAIGSVILTVVLCFLLFGPLNNVFSDITTVKSGSVVAVAKDTVVIHDTIRIIDTIKMDGSYTADVKYVGKDMIRIDMSRIGLPVKKIKVKKNK